MGRELLTKLKTLATLEKTSAMEKYEQSHVRKLSYAATEETASGIDNESVAEDHAIFSKEESFDRRDSRMITLIHKYAATFTKHYEIFNKMNHDVEEIVDRFNIILDFIHHQLQIRSSLSLALAKNESKLEKKNEWIPIVTSVSEEKLNNQVSDELVISTDEDGKSMVDILSDHFESSSVNITYKHVKVSGTGHLVDHTYSCEIANLYTEGKSRKKTKAKEEAATEMIKQIIRRQKQNNLPNQITPFNEQQMYELSVKLSEKEDFIEKLEEKCLHMHEPPPLYTIISETGKNNEAYYTLKCEALGYTALGHGIEKFQAKRNAAKSILNLVTMRKKSTVY
ncbi:uncharacterized protein LOC135840375 [Planococcus citri]|uniref:uncharacterized protein LOC135840375 n=1 Tax=Planococcus citri TaxID=170843 RepID=UPI0031F9C87F